MHAVSKVNLKYSKDKFRDYLYFHWVNVDEKIIFPLESSIFALDVKHCFILAYSLRRSVITVSTFERRRLENYHVSQRRFTGFYPVSFMN